MAKEVLEKQQLSDLLNQPKSVDIIQYSTAKVKENQIQQKIKQNNPKPKAKPKNKKGMPTMGNRPKIPTISGINVNY